MAMKKRGKHKPKPKPVIEYPPVPTRKWIPPDKRPKKPKPPPAYIKPEGVTQKLQISSLKKIWHDFTVYGKIGVLTGHYSQTYKKYSFKTNGYQGACNCAVACTFAYIHKMKTWTRYHLDKILDVGDDLYIKSIQQEGARCLTLVEPEQVFNSFFLDRTKVLLDINEGPKVEETLPTVTDQKVREFIKKSVEQFFKKYASGIFVLRNKYLAIWIEKDAYYVFDPTDHDDEGNAWKGVPGEGVSVLFRSKTLADMVECICNNVNVKIPHTKYEIVQCTVSRVTNINTAPPKTFEDFMEDEVTESVETVTPEDEAQAELKPIDILEEKLKKYIKKNKEETTSLKIKIEEISPEVTEALPPSKRPSWLQDTINKNDECMFPIPSKPKLDKISFYLEIKPERMHILRGTTCQTNPKFSKYQGRQSMGNAIAALIMLRINKSKVWVPRIVDSILRYGDLLYKEAMKSIPRTQSLKLSNFQRKSEVENRNFLPVVQDYVVVGKLQSLEYDVLDLLPALENYLIDHDCCVVLGPVTLAVWVENGFFYWFDPNERDKQGMAVAKTTSISGQTVSIDAVPGVACVIKFSQLKDLVHLYMLNVEKPKKFDPFYLSGVQINDYVEVPNPWYDFTGIVPGKWILRGTIMQASKKFPKKSRNYQSPAMCFAALAFQTLVPEKDWNAKIVDEILELGDKLYNESIEALKSNDKLISKMLTISEVKTDLNFRKKFASFEVGECCVNGIINASRYRGVKDLLKGLEEFFVDNELGVVTTHNLSVAIWKKDNMYYTFDSHPRNNKGLATNYGTACVLRVMDLKELAQSLEMNLSPGKEDFYNISWIKVKFCEVAGGVIKPPLNNYLKINDNSAILRSLYSEITPKYDINCGKQTVPMGLMALAFNKLKPSKEWNKADLDEIINKGNDFYTTTMEDILKEELKPKEEEGGEEGIEGSVATTTDTAIVNEGLDADLSKQGEETEDKPEEDGFVDSNNVNKEFNVGMNKITAEFETFAEGNIKENLKESLKSFFEQEQTEEYFNQEALIESKPLSLVVWRDDKVFYCFDSKPRDRRGKVIGSVEWTPYVPPVKPEDGEAETDKKDNAESEADREETKTAKGKRGEGDTDEEELGEEGLDKRAEESKEDKEDTEEKPKKDMPDEAKGDEDKAKEKNERKEETDDEKDKDKEEDKEKDKEKDKNKDTKKSTKKKPPSYWKEQEKNGRACTLWFTKLDLLINHVYSNISPENAYKQDFTLKSVKLTNNVVLKDRLKPEDKRNDVYAGNWYDFHEISNGRWIMRGTMNLKDLMFPEENRGKQAITASLVAIAIAFVFSMLCFDKYTVDTILMYGDKLYTFMKRMRKKLLKAIDVKLKDDEIDWLVLHENYDLRDVIKKLCFWKFYVDIDVEENNVVGDIHSEVEDINNVERGLEKFFSENQYGLMQCKDHIVAIWRGQKVYYMFDGMSRGPNGIKTPNGTACITRYLRLKDMSDIFLANLPTFGRNSFSIHRVWMNRDLCPRIREAKELRENPKKKDINPSGFKNVVAGKCIVHGNFSQQDPKFVHSSALLSAPIAIIALTMSLIHKPNTWSRPIVDDILELGAELCDESINELGYDFNPWEDTLDISRVKNIYNVGVLRASCEFRHRDQKGVIDSKSSYIVNLRQGLEQFFEENTHGVLTAANLTLAIWEEKEDKRSDPLIYMFDPNPRGPTGMPLDTGTACVMTFVNSKVASDHILGCILEPEQKMREFSIVPVEIVVGHPKSKKKAKKTTASEVNVLPRCSKLVADEEKKLLRKIAANERKRKKEKELQKIGRAGFYILKNGDAILRGYRSQNSKNYNENSRNNQDITNCVVALVMKFLIPIEKWIGKLIDLILDTGDQLYIDSYIAYNPADKKLGLENVMRKFYLKDIEIHITVYQPVIHDIFNVSNLNKILTVYFQQESHCMLSYTDQWVSIFVKEGFFYLFDPHDRDIEGNPVKEKEEGTAVVLRFDNMSSLALKVVQNLYVDLEKSVKEFYLWLLSIETK